MAGQIAGYGFRQGTGSTPGPSTGGIQANLADNQIPVYRSSSNTLENSGFQINPISRSLQGATNIETLADIQSAVSTFRLGQAHTMTSAAENVSFRNVITGSVFHPTWQTTEQDGDWASVQRTPVGDLVQDFVFQADNSETVTNPDFMFTSLAFNHRLYEVKIEPVADVDNVIVVIQQNNGTEFVDYWRSRLINLTTSQLASPSPQNIAINPFIDLVASTQYRLIVLSEGDIQLRGSADGMPRILLTYRQWEDVPIALKRDSIPGPAGPPGTNAIEVREDGTPVSTNINTLNFGSIFDILITGQTASITIPGGTGINWRHQEFRAGTLSVLSRTWYRQTSNNLVNARMPSTDFLPAGWHAFFANDSNSGEMALFGDFDRGLGRVFINPNRGREISWNGTIFLQGSDRQFTASRNFRSFSGNPVNPGKVITAPDGSTYTAGANGFNSNESDIVRNHVRNTNIRLTNNIRYTFDLPFLTSATFELTPIDSGYEIEADGSTTVTVRPMSDDEIIIMDGRHYNFNSPMFVRRNARVAIRRLNENQWIVFDSSGSIAGGFNP